MSLPGTSSGIDPHVSIGFIESIRLDCHSRTTHPVTGTRRTAHVPSSTADVLDAVVKVMAGRAGTEVAQRGQRTCTVAGA